MIDGRNFAIVSDEYNKADSLKKVLESILPSAAVKTYRFDDFTPPKYGADFNRDKPIVIIVASSILDYAREVNIIRRLRICKDLDEDARKVPVFLLTYEDHLGIIKRYPDGILLLSEGCTIIQIPFKIDYLKIKIETAKGVKDHDRLRNYLQPENRLVQIEEKDKHRLANLLGPLRLLSGAYYSGEFVGVGKKDKEIYDKVMNKITSHLKKIQTLEDYYSEYKDLNDAFSPLRLKAENKEVVRRETKEKLSEKLQGLSILFIDDEHKNGWSEVLRQLFIPGSHEYLIIDVGYAMTKELWGFEWWTVNDCTYGTTLQCVSKVGKSEKPDDLGNIEKLLGLKDRKKNWIDYDLILLDLRLKKESSKLSVKETSGYLLLKAIREKDTTVPVIIFTASEKAATLRTLQELGVSGYFIKEFHGGNDNLLRQNFEFFKQSIINATEKYYLRDIWFYTITFKEMFRSSFKNGQEYYNLLETAYFKIQHPNNPYDYNMAVLLYHDCLNRYTAYDANLTAVDLKTKIYDRIDMLKPPYKKIASLLNELRNDIAHDDEKHKAGRNDIVHEVYKKERYKVSEDQAVVAFLSIIYILSKGKLPDIKYSNGFKTSLRNFCEIIPEGFHRKHKQKQLSL